MRLTTPRIPAIGGSTVMRVPGNHRGWLSSARSRQVRPGSCGNPTFAPGEGADASEKGESGWSNVRRWVGLGRARGSTARRSPTGLGAGELTDVDAKRIVDSLLYGSSQLL